MIESCPEPTTDPLVVRPGGIDDLDAVMAIMTSSFCPSFGEGWSRSQCAGILPMAGVQLTLAEQGGAIIGFSLMRAVMDEAELLLVGVGPDARRRGVGGRLVAHFIGEARGRGARNLHLEVRDGNDAISLYRAAGFETAGRRRDYYRGPDAIRYDAITLMLAG